MFRNYQNFLKTKKKKLQATSSKPQAPGGGYV